MTLAWLWLIACKRDAEPKDTATIDTDVAPPSESDPPGRSDTHSSVASDTGVGTDSDPDTMTPPSDTAAPIPPGGPPGDYVGSPLPRDLNPMPTQQQLDALTAGQREFAFGLYRSLAALDEENLVSSPHSVASVFALLLPGAEGSTEDEIRATLHFELPEPDLHVAFDRLHLELAGRGGLPGAPLTDTGGTADPLAFELRVVNALFAREGARFLGPYLDTIATYYGTGPYALDFVGHAEESRSAINDWVAAETHDRIVDLLPEGYIGPSTVLALVNAIFFKAEWYLPFDPGATRDGSFTRLDGVVVTAPIMNQISEKHLGYAEGVDWQLVELPVVDTDVVFTVILPASGAFRDLEDRIDRAFFDDALAAIQEETVALSLPKFTYGSVAELSGTLQAMGMNAPFEAADFSDLSPDAAALGAIHTKGFVGVDELGIEAAAAAAGTVLDSGPGRIVRMNVDRPFLWAIRDRPTGQILFLGRVTDPTRT